MICYQSIHHTIVFITFPLQTLSNLKNCTAYLTFLYLDNIHYEAPIEESSSFNIIQSKKRVILEKCSFFFILIEAKAFIRYLTWPLSWVYWTTFRRRPTTKNDFFCILLLRESNGTAIANVKSTNCPRINKHFK